MSQAPNSNRPTAGRPGSRRLARAVSPAFAGLALMLLAGCNAYDHVIVGSVPDDYRTNHPIIISDQPVNIDIPVGAYDRGVTHDQRTALEGFLDGYERRSGSPLQILVPAGSVNQAAAHRVARGMAAIARRDGVPANRISILSYQVPGITVEAPIRLTYSRVRASTAPCGRWPDDLLHDSENKHYADFGCSFQHDLAAQVSDPNDLIGPRKQGDIDAERRGEILQTYRTTPPDRIEPAPDISYDW